LRSILIIGSAGFIGSNLAINTLKNGYNVYGIDIMGLSFSDYNYYNISIASVEFQSLMKQVKFDFIVNCSGSADVSFSFSNPAKDFELNVTNVFIVLNAIKEYQPNTKYIHFSSAAVYGNPSVFPIVETTLVKPISNYGFHKHHSEQICEQFSILYNLDIKIIRAFSVFGYGLKKQLLWDIFQKGRFNDAVVFWGTGEETRDFIFIDDLVSAIFCILSNPNSKLEVYNVANGKSVKIRNVIESFYEALGWNRNISFNQLQKVGDPVFWKVDVKKLVDLGYKQSFSLKQGLFETAKWYQQHVSSY